MLGLSRRVYQMSDSGQTRQSTTAPTCSGLAPNVDIRSARLVAQGEPNGLLDAGDMTGCETWHRSLNAIERLQAKAPAEGEGVH